jgi:hypothetical protein
MHLEKVYDCTNIHNYISVNIRMSSSHCMCNEGEIKKMKEKELAIVNYNAAMKKRKKKKDEEKI